MSYKMKEVKVHGMKLHIRNNRVHYCTHNANKPWQESGSLQNWHKKTSNFYIPMKSIVTLLIKTQR